MTKTTSPSIIGQTGSTNLKSIIMPIETKNTLLKRSRIPVNARSTAPFCGISATIAPSRNAPRASE